MTLYFRYRYPSIFVIYQTIPTTVLAVLVLVGVSARTKLFCRSKDLVESVKNPTPFCIVTGKPHVLEYTISNWLHTR